MSAVELDRALADAGADLGDLLDLADDAIAEAGRDPEALDGLAARLERAAAVRGPGATPLRIAAAHARARRSSAGARARRGDATEAEAEAEAAAPAEPADVPEDAEDAEVAEIAGLGPRALALCVDVVVMLAGFWVGDEAGVSGRLVLVLALAYLSVPRALGLNTAGKALAGIEILRANGSEQVGLVRMLVRTLAHAGLWLTVVGGIVDILVAALHGHRRSLHDLIADTVVVRSAPPRREG